MVKLLPEAMSVAKVAVTLYYSSVLEFVRPDSDEK